MQTCDNNVQRLLEQSYSAIQNGYQDGISPNNVMTTYGTMSPTYQAFVQLQGQLSMYAVQYGTQGSADSEIQAATAQDGGINGECQNYVQQDQNASAPAQPAAPAASLGPTASTTGCPSSAQLLAAWTAAPAAARRSWMSLTPSGMSGITCWQAWAVASPIVNGNGLVVFHEQGSQWQLLPETQLSQFNAAVCGVQGAPADWSGPAGPATCSPG